MASLMGNNAKPWLYRLCSFTLMLTLLLADVFVFLEEGLFRATPVEAAIGDFSIFTEATGGEVVTTTAFSTTWDTTVQADPNITLAGNTTDIALTEGGKYFVTYNVWTEEGATGGANRRSVATYLTLDGTTSPYGWGGGYISDADNDVNAYNSGAAILDATAAQNLRVVARRDDTNPGGGTAIRGGTNGVNVLKLDDNLDYLRIYKNTRSADISANTTFTDVTWDTADEVDAGSFAFTPASANVTVKGDADQLFLVTANVKLNVDAGSGPRQNYEMRLTLDGVEVPGTRTTTYLRFDDGDINGTMQYVGVIKKTAVGDQTFNVEVRNEAQASGATDIVANETALAMVALPAGAKTISLTNGANQLLTSAQTVMNWNDQITIDSTHYTHSTTVNNDNVEIATAGNYLFFASTYTSRASGKASDVPRLDWRVGGVTQTYGGHGSYNRGDQANEDTYTSGAASAVIFPNLIAGDVVELLHSDETTGTPNSNFLADRIGLQAVEISSLLPPASTDVSVSGSQPATLEPDTANVELGEQYVITENDGVRNVTSITISENGTVAADTGLANVRLLYDTDTTAPYDCASVSYSGNESQYGATSTFSGVDGTITFTDSESIATTKALCIYVVFDITATATNGETVAIYINNPSTDVVVSSGGTVNPSSNVGTSFTTLTSIDFTQANYHWRNDDGSEIGATSASGGIENSPGLAFDTFTTQRLRLGVNTSGGGSGSKSFRLEFAERVTTCTDVVTWTDVGAGGGAWDMFDSANLAEAGDTTNITVANGGVSDGVGTLVSPNGGIRDITSQTGSISVTADDFVELEYSVRATGAATEGVVYCFRVTDAGTPLKNYTNYAEATLSADVTAATLGTQTATVVAGTNNFHVGGQFTFISNAGSYTLNDLTVTETGTIDAEQYLSNPRIAYDLDATNPRDCVGETYDGTEPVVTGSSFTDPNGTTTATIAQDVRVNQSVCVYVVVDVADDVLDGETIAFEISNPSIDAVLAAGSVEPGTPVELAGTTVVQAGSLSQTGYHWRNDDGNEAGATSASGGTENTPIADIFQNTQQRLRFAVANDGSASAITTGLRLEYGVKVTSCENVGSWERVDTGVAFDMDPTSQLVQGDDTSDLAIGSGGVTNPSTSLLTPNSAQLETTDQLVARTVATTEYLKLEYALSLTTESSYSATYCFRLTDAGTPFDTYTNYAELTVQDRQDFLIQRGSEVVSSTTLTLTAGVDYTAPASNTAAFVRITDTSMTGAGSDTLGATRNPEDLFAYIEGGNNLTSSFSIVRPPTATDNTRVQWEIIEYVGIAGADNEFIVRDAGEVTYGTTGLFATGTAVTSIDDDSDVAVFITGQYNPSSAVTNYNTGLSISSWDAVGDRPVFERGDADGVASRASYAVVEFTGASWNVQRAEHTFTAAGITETESISAVNSLLRTFIHTQKLSGDELFNVDESGHEVWLSSIGAVSFQLESGSTNPGQQRSVAWVIENTQTGDGSMNVYRSSGLIAATSTQPNSYVYAIGANVLPPNASIWANTRSTGVDSSHPRAQLGARVLNKTQFELWKSDEAENQSFRVEIVDWPVAKTSIRQTHYRFYVDNDALTPTDPWPAGASDLGENTSMTDVDDPLGEGERTRIRMGLFINNASLVADSVNFKLQYARRVTSCTAVASWNDVGASGSGDIWRAYDATPVDGTELLGGGALLLSVSNVAGTYEENSPSAPNPNLVDIGEYVEYDWHLENNGALPKNSYCFRMVEGDGTLIDGYESYPTTRTSGYTPVIANWRWYTDEENLTPSTPAAGENAAPSAVVNGEELKLRVSVTEVEGALGENIKFNLQYSQYPDFRDAAVLNATTSCEGNSLWCYADGAGDDNDILQSTVLTGVDSCVSGTGNGCGTRNEAEGSSGSYNQPAFSTSEHEFVLQHDGARVNGVYYFRLVDATNDSPIFASSSYPSLTTEGAVLTFAVSGLDANTVTEGVTTDATTTPTTVDFGSLPMDTDVNAAQRLTVFTNGTEGYRVYMNVDQPLTNSYGGTLDGLTSTNAAPATWASECTVVDTGCFGYHVGDNALYEGSLRFALDDTFAGVESGPVEVMASNVPVTFDVSEIVYRTRVGFLQPAGDYTSTVQYIVVPIF